MYFAQTEKEYISLRGDCYSFIVHFSSTNSVITTLTATLMIVINDGSNDELYITVLLAAVRHHHITF